MHKNKERRYNVYTQL